MYTDAGLTFCSAQAFASASQTGLASATSLGAGQWGGFTGVTSSTAIDLTGAGSGTAPNMYYGPNVYGADMGVGDGMAVPKILCSVSTSFATATTAAFVVAAQFAGSTTSNTASQYITYAETGAISCTSNQLAAGNEIGTFDLPRRPQGFATPTTAGQYMLPRFIQLLFVTGPTTQAWFTQGSVNAGIVIQKDMHNAGIYSPANFTVAS